MPFTHNSFDDSSVELPPDLVKPGMHITILRWLPFRDYSWVGDILHVLAVNAPFIVVNLRRMGRTSRLIIDTRKVALQQLSDDFVLAAGVSPSTVKSE